MFAKNRRGTIQLSALTVACAAFSIAVVRLVEVILGHVSVDWVDVLYVALLTPLTVGALAGVLTLIISTLDESHYGRAGAKRWAVIGLGFGLWWGAASHLLPAFDSLIVDRLVRGALQLGGALWLYWLMFKLLPPRIVSLNADERVSDD